MAEAEAVGVAEGEEGDVASTKYSICDISLQCTLVR